MALQGRAEEGIALGNALLGRLLARLEVGPGWGYCCGYCAIWRAHQRLS